MASKYNQFEKLPREIGVSIIISDVEKQLQCLRGQDQKASLQFLFRRIK